MPRFTKKHAEESVKKLKKKRARQTGSFSVTTSEGGNHTRYEISYSGALVCSFGINRGSKSDVGHKWVHEQKALNQREGLEFASCTLSLEDYAELLKERGVISEEE